MLVWVEFIKKNIFWVWKVHWWQITILFSPYSAFKNCQLLFKIAVVLPHHRISVEQANEFELNMIRVTYSYSKSQITSRMILKKTWIKRETWITFQNVCWIKLTYAFMNTLQNKNFFQEMTKDVSYSTSDVLPE